MLKTQNHRKLYKNNRYAFKEMNEKINNKKS